MADLMGSYIPDLVLKIDNGELVQLLNHLPNVPAHQTFWEKFFDTPVAVVAACSAIVTVFVSFGTLGVTIFNSVLTKKFTEANHDLARQQAVITKSNHDIAKQQAETALENKEIAKRKYNLDVINKRWSFLQGYLDEIDIICANIVMEYGIEYLEKTNEIDIYVFYNYRLKDLIRKKKAYNEIKSYEIIFKSFISPETEHYFHILASDIEVLFSKMTRYNDSGTNTNDITDAFIQYEQYFEEYKEKIYHSRAIFTSCFIGMDLDGMNLIK